MEREYVGVDLHRRRSVIYRMNAAGEQLSCVRVPNEPAVFAEAISAAAPGSDVVIEATYGWYWAADLVAELGYRVRLANPHGNDWGKRRVKNDERDARDLADLLRLGRLAEAWVAPPAVRELRELVRFRAKLSNLRGGLKAQAHAVMAKNGVLPAVGDMWGPTGTAQFDSLDLADAYTHRLTVLRELIASYDHQIQVLDRDIHRPVARRPRLSGRPGDPRGGSGVRGGVRGRDRRRRPVRLARRVVLVGRADPAASRVRHQGAPGRSHQTRIAAGALGRHRSGGPLPRR